MKSNKKINTVKLLDVVSIGGKNVKEFDNELMYLSTGDLEESNIVNLEPVTFDSRPSRANQLVEINDILFAKMKDTRKTLLINENTKNIIVSTGFYVLRTSNKVLPKYIYHYLNSDYFLNQKNKLCKGATQKAINNDGLKQIDIVLYDDKIQDKIVELLDKSQQLIDKRKEQIEALDELVKSQFIEMFGDPITNPKEWNTAKLGDICTISRGGSPRPIDKFLGGPIPWIKIGDATKGDDIYLYKTKEGIIEEGVKKSRLIKKGGLIFANCGVSLGFARILKIDGCIHDGWLAFEDFEKHLDKIFFLKSLNYCTEYFRRTAPDGTQPNLNTGIMREYVQILPPMKLQQEFTKFIKQVDKLKFEMEKSLKELEDNFNSLMQKAFKG